MMNRGIPPLTPFERSPITDALVEWLREVHVDEVVEYRTLTEVAGEPIFGGHPLLRSARDILWKESIMFDAVPTVGLKRLNDDAKVGAADSYLTKAKNAGRRARRSLQATDVAALSPMARARYWVADVRAGVLAQFAGRRATSAIKRALQSGQEPKKLRDAVSESLKQF